MAPVKPFTYQAHTYEQRVVIDGQEKTFRIIHREYVSGQPRESDREYHLLLTANYSLGGLGPQVIRWKDEHYVPLEATSLAEAFAMAPEVEAKWIAEQKARMTKPKLAMPAGYNGKSK